MEKIYEIYFVSKCNKFIKHCDDNFKNFYYNEERYSPSELNEAIKICIVFLKNAIELMLKDILASIDPMSIYNGVFSKQYIRCTN